MEANQLGCGYQFNLIGFEMTKFILGDKLNKEQTNAIT